MADDELEKQNGNEGQSVEAEAEGIQGEVMPENADAEVPLSEADVELAEKIKEAVDIALLEQQDTMLRAKAEVQNMRRRCDADVEKAHKFALEKFSVAMLAVMDNMERALQAVSDKDDDNVKALFDGVELTQKGLLETFEKFKIKQLDPEGEPFDPQLHQAMSMVVNKDVEPNTIIAVMQKGYSLNDRVIRPAMVMVSKGE